MEQEKETWLQKNAVSLMSFLLSLAVIVIGGVYSYGRVTEQLLGYKTELIKVESDLEKLNAKVDAHHADTKRHIDERQWDMLQSQIRELNDNLKLHMRRTGY